MRRQYLRHVRVLLHRRYVKRPTRLQQPTAILIATTALDNSRTNHCLEIPKGPVNNFVDASKSDMAKFAKWHREMLKRGVYLAPSQYEAGFTSLAHTEEDIDRTIQIAREVMAIL